MTPADITICVVNYRTLDLTRLCLRSIRRFAPGVSDVLVVDNDSGDPSLDYLRGLSWIRLIERRPETPDRDGSSAHGAALDLGLTHCRTPLFLSLHSDTVLLREDWLDLLLAPFADPRVASVGTGKLELKPRWLQRLQRATDYRALWRRCCADEAERLRFRPFNTTICSAYRAAILRDEALSFLGPRRLTVGRELHLALIDRGHRTVHLPAAGAGRCIAHLAHATQALHPEEFGMLGRGQRKYLRRARRVLDRPVVRALLADASLDA